MKPIYIFTSLLLLFVQLETLASEKNPASKMRDSETKRGYATPTGSHKHPIPRGAFAKALAFASFAEALPAPQDPEHGAGSSATPSPDRCSSATASVDDDALFEPPPPLVKRQFRKRLNIDPSVNFCTIQVTSQPADDPDKDFETLVKKANRLYKEKGDLDPSIYAHHHSVTIDGTAYCQEEVSLDILKNTLPDLEERSQSFFFSIKIIKLGFSIRIFDITKESLAYSVVLMMLDAERFRGTMRSYQLFGSDDPRNVCVDKIEIIEDTIFVKVTRPLPLRPKKSSHI